MQIEELKPRYWLPRLPEWVGAGIVAAVVSIPIGVLIGVLIARHYYERSLHDSEVQAKLFRSIVEDAVREGVVKAQYNAKGQIVALHRPAAPTISVH